ncbi:vacuolar calcium ion transporter [Lasiosphaeria ovina]|uniref:Vacuolar calcium ion transporter n=1 Tax=Lasiosphaeria ovina TaxID=92902 RepID=A0AAE0NJN4_9PEZI|nr:vacuolar calcium ion transporter [Lasiosphaeria ovina]
MHRVKAWARQKAREKPHGSPSLTSTPSRSNSRVRNGNTIHASPPLVPLPASAAPTPNPDPAVEQSKPEQPAEEAISAPSVKSKKSVAIRFYQTVKDILFSSPINVLLVFVPVGIAVHFAHLPGGVVFAMNAIAIIPLAGLLSHATEIVARELGDTIGALMNVTFGNAVELIIFIIALVKDEIRIVQASLVGSILANLLLIMGMCFLFGGLRYREQIYNSTVTQMSACLLSLSVTSLLLPTAFHASFSDVINADDKVLKVSRGTSVILLLVYFLYLLFQLSSHSYMYESTPQHIIERESVPGPAAQYFNGSSSSSSDSSSSSSSSDSESGSSSRSTSTANRLKRMMKRGKRSPARQDPPSASIREEPGSSTPSTMEPKTSRSVGDEDRIMSLDAVADGTLSESDRPAERRKKHHKKRKHHSKKTPRPEDGNNGVELVQLAQASGSEETRRVDFALAPNLEAQDETRPKPFSLRSMRSPVFSARPIINPVGSPPVLSPAPDRPIQRARSMPTERSQAYHAPPGAIPPIVPILVNDAPSTTAGGDDEDDEKPDASRTTAIILLLVSTGLVAVCAEFMIDSINEVVANDSGLSEAFIGLILLPIVGNAAEHVTAVTVAFKNKMDLAIGVALGSSIQIALFVTPLVVILGWIMGKDMSLFFTLFETISMFVSAFIVNFLVLDGRSNYLEGALLCSAYVIIAVAAFFYPNADAANAIGGGSAT